MLKDENVNLLEKVCYNSCMCCDQFSEIGEEEVSSLCTALVIIQLFSQI
jgi:hypothetical protein